MIQKKFLGWMLLCALTGVGCQNNALTPPEEEPSLKPNTGRASLDAGVSLNAYVDTSTYISSGFNFLNSSQINKNRQAIGGNAYTEVYGFNIPEENRVRGIRWNTDDETTSLWRPQGIAGFSKDGVRYLLVSWYAKDEAAFKGSRITLIDISPSSSTYLTYRHILLVQPDIPASVTDYSQYASYAPLNVHAGGMAYFKGKLYISSTNLGVRIFDLNKIIEVSTGDTTNDKCGKDSNGNLFAFNYRYILPQTGYQKINNANPFSTIQVNDEGTQFWTGQYYSGSADASIVPKVFGFPVDANGILQNSGIVSVAPKNSLFTENHAHGIQGVFRKGNRIWLSCTGSPSNSYGSNARLARYTDGADDTVRFRWPYGAESLYHESQYNYLWSLTEFEPNAGAQNGSQVNRCIFAVDFSKYE
uniref:Lipoprotein n=1 Tax=Chryseobacterium endophyticum TaxID=1854762 RepID=A0AAU6WL24_9FLAO